MEGSTKRSDRHLRDFYNFILSQLLYFLLQLQEGEKTVVCCKEILELLESCKMSVDWLQYKKAYELLDQVTADLKTLLLTTISCDENYSIHETVNESKYFMTQGDYIDVLEKLLYFRCDVSAN